MNAMDIFIIVFLLILLAATTVTDLRAQRIPNYMTFPAMLIAIAYHVLTGGLDGLIFSLSGFGIGLAVMLPPFLFGVMGAGDVKLMAAVGAALGAAGVFAAFIFTSIIGAGYALVVLLSHRHVLKRLFTSFRNAFVVFLGTHKIQFAAPETDKALPKLCYGLAIALGTVLAMIWMNTKTPWI